MSMPKLVTHVQVCRSIAEAIAEQAARADIAHNSDLGVEVCIAPNTIDYADAEAVVANKLGSEESARSEMESYLDDLDKNIDHKVTFYWDCWDE